MTKQPSYRFVGYTEPWGEKKLGEVGDFSIKTNSFSREKLSLNSGEIKNIHYGDILVKYNSTLDFENNSIPYVIDNDTKLTSDMFLKNGDIIFSDAAEDYSVGKCVELFNVSGNIVSGLHTIVCRPEIDFARYFLGYYLNSNSYRQQVLPMVQGAKVSSISKGNLSKTNISFPSLPEQTAIGSFLQDIDQLISLQQRKLEVLKEQKKTYLKLLFPAKGQTKPALRFAGFEDDWKEVKLGEVATITMGQSPNSENYTDNPNDYILVQGNADMKNGRVFPRVWTTQITKQAKQGNLILSVRAPVGDIGKTDYDVVLGRGVASIDGNEFLYQVLSQMKQNGYWSKLSTGSTFESINSNDIKSAIISLPSLPEQEVIGSFFQDLDKAIAKQEEKVNQLKESKQTLLRKMFI